MIKPVLNGMLVLVLVKFMLNDVPHAADMMQHDRYSEPPTPGQLRYIAVLTMQLHLPEPHVETSGEAGRMIRELEEERKSRRQLR